MRVLIHTAVLLGIAGMAAAQDGAVAATNATAAGSRHDRSAPVYTVTVISRSVKAINYGHRTEPTKIDFRGTVLMPDARGEATVRSRRGAVEVKADFDHVAPPTMYGAEYLTYVLWAITPEGRPANLGELVLDPSNKGKLTVSTNLQAFALIVTAEPYFSVTRPSGVVVMENFVRPDTVGTIEEVNAKYELFPREHFTFQVPDQTAVSRAPKVSYGEYEATLALYQALNALQIAKSAEADRYAEAEYLKAARLYNQARDQSQNQAASREVVTTAREAAQAAEDAREIAVKRQADSAANR